MKGTSRTTSQTGKANFIKKQGNCSVRVNLVMGNWMDKGSNTIRMDRCTLKGNGSRIKLMAMPLFILRLERKWLRAVLIRESFQERELSTTKMGIKELRENGLMVINAIFCIIFLDKM